MNELKESMLLFQQQLAKQYQYLPLPKSLSQDVKALYLKTLPDWCCLNGNRTPLHTSEGTVICNGYNRIVIGDYGAFVEIAPNDMNLSCVQCKTGQEYRINDPKYSKNVKYEWLTAKDKSDCKIYRQKRRVSYADYIAGMYYVSPFEVSPDILPSWEFSPNPPEWVCPHCGIAVETGLDADLWSAYWPPYCPNCGERVNKPNC